jgi:hypothetical protein
VMRSGVGEVCLLVKGSLLGDECLLDGGVGDERRRDEESRVGDEGGSVRCVCWREVWVVRSE